MCVTRLHWFQGFTLVGECEGWWGFEHLKRLWSPGIVPKVRCNALLFPSESAWLSRGGVNWERPAVFVAIFLLVILALELQLPCFYISTPVTQVGCSLCFSSGCCRFPWGFVLALGWYGVGEGVLWDRRWRSQPLWLSFLAGNGDC